MQLGLLVRRIGRGGCHAVDHPPGGHDVMNSAAVALVASNGAPRYLAPRGVRV